MNHSTEETLTMTYSSLLTKNGRKAICVRFERNNSADTDYVEAILPECKITKQKGFSEDEITQLQLYLKFNKDEILKSAKQITGFMNWFKDNKTQE